MSSIPQQLRLMPSHFPELAAHPLFRSLGWLLGFALAVYLTAQPLLTPTVPGSGVRLMWIPGALLALAFATRPRSEAPGYALIYAAITLAAEQSLADLHFDLALVMIEIGQAATFAWLEQRYFPLPRMAGNPVVMMGYLLMLLAVTAAAATMMIAVAGSLPLSPSTFAEELANQPALAWRNWWLGNATSYLTVASTLCFLGSLRAEAWHETFDDPRERRAYLLMVSALLVTAVVVFPVNDISWLNLAPDVKLALTMLAPPLGFALAARYRGFGAAATILILTPLALVSATGPQAAVNWRDLPPMATLMHLFLIVVAATCWILAAISRQLKWAVAEAVEAEKRKARFVATINHELRTPLNAILGFAELMRLQELKEDSAAVDDIQNSGKRLLAMVERVLSQSDRGASVFQLNRQRIRLNTIFVRVLEDVRPDCERAGCTIEVATPPDLLVTVDPRALRQMLLVLMSQPLRRSSAGSSILISGLRSPAGVVIEVQADGLSEGAQDSRDKLEIQLLNALALAQGGRLEMVREGRASRLARLTLFEDRAQLDRSGGNRGIAG